jgi:surface antigen
MTRRTTLVAALCLSLGACAVPPGVGGSGPKSIVGGLGGAAAGGLLGSQFGHGGGKLAMTGLGVLAGALAGGAAGAALDQADRTALERNTETALNTQPIGQPIVWSNAQTGHQVTVTPTREGYSGDRYCREYQQRVVVGGRSQKGYGQACRQPDGSWSIVQ